MKALATRIILIPLLLFSSFLCLLNPRIIGILGRGLGNFLRIVGFRKKVVMGNLELALGNELSLQERQNLARRVYHHIGIVFIEIARHFSISDSQALREMQFSEECLANILAAMSNGKGAIFITGHIGNWELVAMGSAMVGLPLSIVAKRMNSAVSQVLIERHRLRTKMEIIYSGGAIEQIKTHLARGRAIGFMVDQNTTGPKGIRANFFGVPASSIRALAKLVRDTKTNVVPIFSVRQPDGRYKANVLDPLPYLEAPHLPPGSPERWAREEWLNTQQYQAAIEKIIRNNPEQWLWIHRRWKTSRVPLDMDTAHLENMAHSSS